MFWGVVYEELVSESQDGWMLSTYKLDSHFIVFSYVSCDENFPKSATSWIELKLVLLFEDKRLHIFEGGLLATFLNHYLLRCDRWCLLQTSTLNRLFAPTLLVLLVHFGIIIQCSTLVTPLMFGAVISVSGQDSATTGCRFHCFYWWSNLLYIVVVVEQVKKAFVYYKL